MRISLAIIISISLLICCRPHNKKEDIKGYKIINDEGVYVEKFDTTNSNENRYTANNQTFKEGNKLTFDYYYEDLNGKKYKFQEFDGAGNLDFKEMKKAWFFVPLDSLNEKTIDKVILRVKYGLQPMINNNPDYNQTVISYKYPQVNGKVKFSSSTGVVENEKNVWMHPPRDRFFRILELNPFPFIQAPYELGNKWNWSLRIGSFWGDERWKTWNGSIENQYYYEIIAKEKFKLKMGEIECLVVKSSATSSIGKTHLVSYFNKEYGFVKLEYKNIDSTRTVLELIEFESK